MALSKFAARRRGFTLIELLIVIVVIAILALIVVPRLMGAARKAKESALKANLQRIRGAVAHFQADTGLFPILLADLITEPTQGTNAELATPAPENLSPDSWKGPYLEPKGGIPDVPGVPMNPFVAPAAGQGEEDHWLYVTDDGTVTVPAALADLTTVDGVAYSAL